MLNFERINISSEIIYACFVHLEPHNKEYFNKVLEKCICWTTHHQRIGCISLSLKPSSETIKDHLVIGFREYRESVFLLYFIYVNFKVYTFWDLLKIGSFSQLISPAARAPFAQSSLHLMIFWPVFLLLSLLRHTLVRFVAVRLPRRQDIHWQFWVDLNADIHVFSILIWLLLLISSFALMMFTTSLFQQGPIM